MPMTLTDATAYGLIRIFDSLAAPQGSRRMVTPCLAEPARPAPSRVLRWDGLEALTIDGEPAVTIRVWTAVALAEAILKIALPEVATAALAEAYANEVIGRLARCPFALPTSYVERWCATRGARR